MTPLGGGVFRGPENRRAASSCRQGGEDWERRRPAGKVGTGLEARWEVGTQPRRGRVLASGPQASGPRQGWH